MTSTTEANKAVVRRFNKEVIEQGNMDALAELTAEGFVNHTAAPGMSKGPDGMASFFTNILHPAFSDLEVQIHDQIAEGDKVVTRKSIVGTHRGPFLGVQATGRRIEIKITDIVRVVDGKYVEHWGSADMFGAHAQMTRAD
jgi:predicted ester cyclase